MDIPPFIYPLNSLSTIVTNAALNLGVQISSRSCLPFCWGPTQKWNCMDHMVILFFIFWGATMLLPMVFYLPYGSTWGFQLLHSLTNTYYFLGFDSSPSHKYEVVCCGFDLHFPADERWWESLNVLIRTSSPHHPHHPPCTHSVWKFWGQGSNLSQLQPPS